MASAFQRTAFQINAFQIGTVVTSLGKLQLPVDYYMEGLPQYRETGRTFEQMKGEAGETVKMSAGRRGRLSGAKSSFTTATTKRGYD